MLLPDKNMSVGLLSMSATCSVKTKLFVRQTQTDVKYFASELPFIMQPNNYALFKLQQCKHDPKDCVFIQRN